MGGIETQTAVGLEQSIDFAALLLSAPDRSDILDVFENALASLGLHRFVIARYSPTKETTLILTNMSEDLAEDVWTLDSSFEKPSSLTYSQNRLPHYLTVDGSKLRDKNSHLASEFESAEITSAYRITTQLADGSICVAILLGNTSRLGEESELSLQYWVNCCASRVRHFGMRTPRPVDLTKLHSKEVEALRLLSDGNTLPMIAKQVMLSTYSVNLLLNNAQRKLESSSWSHAVTVAYRKGILD